MIQLITRFLSDLLDYSANLLKTEDLMHIRQLICLSN